MFIRMGRKVPLRGERKRWATSWNELYLVISVRDGVQLGGLKGTVLDENRIGNGK